jgi:hypothetical protein
LTVFGRGSFWKVICRWGELKAPSATVMCAPFGIKVRSGMLSSHRNL